VDAAVVIAVVIGGLIALFGLFIIFMVWLDERRHRARPRGGAAAENGWPALIKEFLRWIKSMTPKPYRLGVMLVAVGVALILGAIALAA
jgi:hypothetical protein